MLPTARHDVAQACRLALEVPEAPNGGGVYNVGSGRPRTVLEVAEKMAAAVGKPHVAPEVTGKYRIGDIRHGFADIRRDWQNASAKSRRSEGDAKEEQMRHYRFLLRGFLCAVAPSRSDCRAQKLGYVQWVSESHLTSTQRPRFERSRQTAPRPKARLHHDLGAT